MYSKDEASQLRQTFWTTFGQYISPVLSAEGLKVNWVNYKTGIKHLYFKMQADKRSASISIEIAHPNPGIQELFYTQFVELKSILTAQLEEQWTWNLHTYNDEGKIISRIFTEVHGVSVFNKNDWPALISFFKTRIIALDEFWSNAKYIFEALK